MLSTSIWLAGRRVHLVHDERACDSCDNRNLHVRLEAGDLLRDEINAAVYRDASALAEFRVLAATDGLLHDVYRVGDAEILAHVGWLLKTGRLLAFECRIAVQNTARPAAPAPRRPAPRTPSRIVEPRVDPLKTWVEIELLDDAGTPIANERYVVKVPGGITKTGSLDSKGRARITDIDPGSCDVSFPDIDGREWKAA